MEPTTVKTKTTIAVFNGTEDGFAIYSTVYQLLGKGLPVEFEYKGLSYTVRKRYSREVFSRWMRIHNTK